MGQFQRKGDRKGQAACWDALIAVNIAKDDHSEALRMATSGLQFIRDIKEPSTDDRRWEAGMCHTMANIYLSDEQYGKCNQVAQTGVSILKELGMQEDMAMVLVTQSNSSLAMKENRDALKQATDARNICRNCGNRGGEAIASIALTGAHCSRFDMVKAVNSATDAVQLFNSEKNKKGEADATFLLAQVHMMAEDFAKAQASAAKAKTLYKECGFAKDEVNMSLMMAQACFFAGIKEGAPEKGSKGGPAWDKALQVAKDGVALAKKSKDDDLISKGLSFVAQVHVMNYQVDEARNVIDEGIAVCTKSGYELGEAYHRTLMTQMYFMNDKHDSAKDPGNKALAIFKKLGDAPGEALINELLKFIDPGEEEYQGPSEEMLAATVMDVALSLIGSESLAGDTPLMDAGLDSLASVEFQNTLAKEFTGVTLPSTLVFDFPTPKMITEHIYNGLRESAKRKALQGK
uniref:Carrier domain-containing protein n=1 Tax=Alexandrium andersonii TaxID=327968 RepID=A0A7S2F7Q9_9DINO